MEFLEKIRGMQSIIRKTSINALKNKALGKETNEDYTEDIKKLKEYAMSLRDEDGINEFSFENDQKFIESVNNFLNFVG